jgi:hypothetical protein
MPGGPLYELYVRSRLSDDALALVHRRMIALPLIAWLPLLILAVADGRAWSGTQVPFLRDVDVQVRLLIVMPLLVGAELVVHRAMPIVVQQFLERGLVRASARAEFDAAVRSAIRLRDSITAELLLLVLVYTLGVGVLWPHALALDVPTWYHVRDDAGWHPTPAGWWFGLVSLPLFQFLFYRWYWRLFIWGRFLLQVTRAGLDLIPLHPDRAAGLGFLNIFALQLVPLLFAQGALAAGKLADDILYQGATLASVQTQIFFSAIILVVLVVAPLMVFTPALHHVRREGLREYGGLGQDYVRDFRAKWLSGAAPGEPLLGSADIQSLADLGNSYDVVREMAHIPVGLRTLAALLIATLLPFSPLLLTAFSLDELVANAVKFLM